MRARACEQVLSLVHKLKSTSTPSSSSGRNDRINGGEDRDGDLVVSAEEFVRFVGGEYEATEAAQGRLRRVLQLAGEKEGVTLEVAFGALDKVLTNTRPMMPPFSHFILASLVRLTDIQPDTRDDVTKLPLLVTTQNQPKVPSPPVTYPSLCIAAV